MLDEHSQREVESMSRDTKVIVFACCAGIISYGVYILFFCELNQAQALPMTVNSVAFSALLGGLSLAIREASLRRARKQLAAGRLNGAEDAFDIHTDAGKLAIQYRLATVTSCILLNFPALGSLYAYQQEGHYAALLSAGTMFVGIAAQWPRGGRISVWVENQLATQGDGR